MSRKNNFKIIVEQDEDGFFIATVPALPGCVTQARTHAELQKRVADAIRLCLQVAKTNPAYRKKIKALAYEPSFIGLEMVTV